ncbi:MAG: hypothetical protein JXB85_10760 [Anaerolineales bacterium]|nr:hypothetical protein [Anaerolineales bacterium]
MKSKIVNIFWGIILIALGGLWLAGRLELIAFELFSEQIWIVLFGVASAAFLLSYFLSGVKNWGWLFPALISAALALTIWMAINDLGGAFMGVPVLAAVALPFYVGYAVERRNWGLLIPAFILTVVALITGLADVVEGEWIGALVLFAIGLPFLVVYLRNRKQKWALIPAWAMIALSAVVLLSGFARGEWIGALVLYAIGLPFLVIYLFDRRNKWALIPAGVLAVIGTIPLLAGLLGDEVVAPAIMFLFAAPFFVLYFWSKDHWWALIPAGVFASIGVVVILAEAGLTPFQVTEGSDPFLTGILFLGFGLTFGALWLRRKTQPTEWAMYPAVGLLAAAVLAVIFGTLFLDYWPAAVLIVIGVMLILGSFRRKKPEEQA